MASLDLTVTRLVSDATGRTAHLAGTSAPAATPVAIDWGDGSAVQSVNGGNIAVDHAYAREGFFRIVASSSGLRETRVYQTGKPMPGAVADVTARQQEDRRAEFAASAGMGEVGRELT